MTLEKIPVKIIGEDKSNFDGGSKYAAPNHEVMALNISGKTNPTGNDLIIFAGRPNLPILLVRETITGGADIEYNYCYLWDCDENDYPEGVVDNDGTPVVWPIRKYRISNWLSEHLRETTDNEPGLDYTFPTHPPYPYCSTDGGFNQGPISKVEGLVYTLDAVCPDGYDYGVSAGVGASVTRHEEMSSNMQPSDPMVIPWTATGHWSGNVVYERYVWLRIHGVHTGDEYPYRIRARVSGGGTGSSETRVYEYTANDGGPAQGTEYTHDLQWTGDMITGIEGIASGESSVSYSAWGQTIIEPVDDRREVDGNEETSERMLTGGVASLGFGQVGRIVVFAHFSADLKADPAPIMDGSVTVQSRWTTVYDAGVEYDVLDPFVYGTNNVAFNAAYRDLLMIAEQKFLGGGPSGYTGGITFARGITYASKAYCCMPYNTGQIVMPTIIAYERKV